MSDMCLKNPPTTFILKWHVWCVCVCGVCVCVAPLPSSTMSQYLEAVPILPIFLSNSEPVCNRTVKFREFLHELTKILGKKPKFGFEYMSNVVLLENL